MFDILPFPNITATDTKGQVEQINNYLIQLKETLEFILTSIDYENLSPELKSRINSLGEDIKSSDDERKDQIQQVANKTLSVSDVINSEAYKASLKGVEEKIPTDYLVSGEQTQTSNESGGKNVYTFTDSNGKQSAFTVMNGLKGDKGDNGEVPTITFSVNFSTGKLEYTSS